MPLSGLSLGHADLEVERLQLADEGADLTPLEDELRSVSALGPDDPELPTRVANCLDAVADLPTKDDDPSAEPSDLAGIRQERPDGPRRMTALMSDADLTDRILAAWSGRCSGCLLGKPVEGWRTPQIWGYLRDTGRYPLEDYFRADVPPEVFEAHGVSPDRAFVDRVSHMPDDDDMNYTVVGLDIMSLHGANFTPSDAAAYWLRHLPPLRTFTAERAAYRNLIQGIAPPESGRRRNPYREWIGAQIRADFWGYVAAGDPERAAEFAWRDACVSHVKNGIYGEMWVAAMLAAAPFTDGEREVIEIGLSEIPTRCRLSAGIRDTMRWHDEGVTYDGAVRRIHEQWDENTKHHWCHTISNAQIVAVGLLWADDYGQAICRAVQAGFDTDCNGATVGSVWGMMHGTASIPPRWTEPIRDTLETGLVGHSLERISGLSARTSDLHKAIRN